MLSNKSSILERDWSKFNKENLILDYFEKKLVKNSPTRSAKCEPIESYLDHANSVLDIHFPFKKVNKYKLRFKIKPWIIPAFRKHISVKNSLLKKFINRNDFQTKEHLHSRY